MWSAIREQWDYFALTCLLGLYVTVALAAVVASILALAKDVLTPPPVFVG